MNIAINGFGRIGRAVFKIALEKGMHIVAINDLSDVKDLAYLLKYDSVYGRYDKKVGIKGGDLEINGKVVKVLAEKDPLNLPWKKLGVDVVIESTGFFTDRIGAEKHLKAGAKFVLITAPAKNPDATIVLGVNDGDLKKEHKIISAASCTTNCLAPIVKVLDDNFGIEQGIMTTVHAYTNDQVVHDQVHRKMRRGRAAGLNIIPTTSGASEAINAVIPRLKGRIDGLALRVPVSVGSIVDFSARLKRPADAAKINEAMKKAAQGTMKGILDYTEDEIVSSDVIGTTCSSLFDATGTIVLGDLVKVFSWYDNEYGYSCRVVDVVRMLR
ncbi:type I glyceraldehyde-3-phosphate dehydrogenase [Candidatus Pacearchaeota archaeon]|nr:type I glyceraldehyde-3-phosphate dehydrogenase [Candidatus Pacearchaeota archaeon]